MKQILVIAAHPDDEILECGGTIAKLVKTGEYKADALIVCEGESLRYKGMNVNQKKATNEVAKIIGYDSVINLNYPDQKLDSFSQIKINQSIEEVCNKIKPSIVFTHYRGDLNRDHQIVSESVLVVLRPVVEYVERIYLFCNQGMQTTASVSFSPNTWVDIESTLEQKKQAFSCYSSEVRNYPHARSLEAIDVIAKSLGVQCNKKAAECFQLYREIL